MKTAILTAVFVAGTSLSAFAEGCSGWGHDAAQLASVETQVETLADDSQVLTTGQISVASVDCAATPGAADCVNVSTPASN